MPLTDPQRLRSLLAEKIPDGGSDVDTLFSDEEIDDFLMQGGTVEAAAYYGWKAKAAEYTNLADVTEGNSSRNFSDMAANALKMVELYAEAAGVGGTSARVKVKKIVRTGGSI
jgi:hypothetical protein